MAARFLNREEQGKEDEILCKSWSIIKCTLTVASALTSVIISVQRAGGILFFHEKVEKLLSSKINIFLVLLCMDHTQECEIVNKNNPEPGPDPVELLLHVFYTSLDQGCH